MEMAKGPLAFLPQLAFTFILCFSVCAGSRTRGDEGKLVSSVLLQFLPLVRNGDKPSWCIAKPSTDNLKLYDNIDYSCKQNGVDCIGIAPGGKCFNPNNAVSHASMAMNLYYKAAGKHTWNCHFNGTGMIVLVDPSVGSCIYQV
ncbi:major pollen allergen Ole e 10-like isoform X2 [Vitis riparia]|uniref:major pollen allergen Ole e 10-like isoform X2 n=1 Tax=Vitis riparia TaxID=96939 RepID=UPI00155A8EBA|nr:major pollen allergen Ole e 10-like isoform X2 [Vitis riparia]